jgi:Fe-S-cluster-containing dehydrogenase component/anaerobic selenocysteine-containing dehydrogenase
LPPRRLSDEKSLWERALDSPGPGDYWRSVRELYSDPLAVAAGDPEFVEGAEKAGVALGRRELMQLLGASVALAGLGACTQSPREKILPYAQRTPELTPGVAAQYATSMLLDGYAIGVLARSNEGRPTKIEGNPEHPASLGATGVYEQASVLDLYNPGRQQAVRHRGAPASWDTAMDALPKDPNARVWFILEPQSSPLIAALITRIAARFPQARFCFDSALSRRSMHASTASVFGGALDPQYDFRRARVTLALGADFLASMPNSVRWSRDFSEGRRNAEPGSSMTRLYMLEPMPTPTGSLADHRLAVRRSDIGPLAAAILAELASLLPAAPALPAALLAGLPRADASQHAAWIRAVARDLAAVPGESIVIAGDTEPASTHMLAHALNLVLGNLGRTVTFSTPALIEPQGGESLESFVAAVRQRAVDAVLILEPNPVYTAPAALDLRRWLAQVPSSFHLTYFENETSRACEWVLPLSHYLESWGDARAYDGTLSFIQPLIEPLYASRSLTEVLAACAGDLISRGHTLLQQHYRDELGAAFDTSWDEQLQLGFRPGSAAPATPTPNARWADLQALLPTLSAASREGLELNLEPSPTLYDGRFAHNAWLQELPHPLTKQCWGNAAVISPNTAVQLELEAGQIVELELNARKIEAPVLVLPGHADASVTLTLGYGQDAPEGLGHGVGVNAYVFLTPGNFFSPGLSLRKTGRTETLAVTQDHSSVRNRPLALLTSLAEYGRDPQFTAHLRGPQPSLLPVYPAKGLQWAMTIDTSICTGCSSCVVACQAENNVPVVGKLEVIRGREMHWLRIDRYFEGPAAAPRVIQQPMLCQHCENAPCEYVCPVNATVHSPDGLNEMVYNRCIGTRFCSNNCPYKVRRFNWFEYTDDKSTISMQRNPDVTVRERGVMEKCTYCVQRIRRAEQQARVERRSIRPGEVVTACQQACPMNAIQFGALEHLDTPMVKWRGEPRTYAALHDLGTRPRTQYLAKIVNLNPELEG